MLGSHFPYFQLSTLKETFNVDSLDINVMLISGDGYSSSPKVSESF